MHEQAHQEAKKALKKAVKGAYNERHGKPGVLERVFAVKTLQGLEAIVSEGLPEGASLKTARKFSKAVAAKMALLKGAE